MKLNGALTGCCYEGRDVEMGRLRGGERERDERGKGERLEREKERE